MPLELKLLEDQEYNLMIYSGDGEAFVKRFRSTWKKIPDKVRDKIVSFWHSQQFLLFELSCYTGNAHALVESYGTVMKFNDHSFQILPPKAAEWIIAHELAHVFQKVLGRLPLGENEEENERHADELAMSWGIDRTCYMMVQVRKDNAGVNFEEACEQIMKDKRLCKYCQ